MGNNDEDMSNIEDDDEVMAALFLSNGVMLYGDGRAESKAQELTAAKDSTASYLFSPTSSPCLSKGVGMPVNGDPMHAQNGDMKSNKQRMEIPLMPFETPLFPGSREFLYIYEMRYRSLMHHAAKSEMIGRCFTSEEGQVGSIGTLCTIVETRKLESGKGFFVIEGQRRFRIVRIKQRVPFIIAEVDLEWNDEEVTAQDDIRGIINLWTTIYVKLKIYLRLARITHMELMHQNGEIIGGDQDEGSRLQREIDMVESRIRNRLSERGDEKKLASLYEAVAGFRTMVEGNEEGRKRDDEEEEEEEGNSIEDDDDDDFEFLSPEVRDTKPPTRDELSSLPDAKIISRATSFSYAVANLLSTDETVLQQLLQSTSLILRLKGLQASLDEALEDVEDAMAGGELDELIQEVVAQSRREDDDDSDLMPPSGYTGVTLDSMLDNKLLLELDEKDSGVFQERVLHGKRVHMNSSGSDDDPDAEDDIWNATSNYAFQ
jgi:Lon protease-like protein